jgi:Cys-rich protein (TIGR04453 family)
VKKFSVTTFVFLLVLTFHNVKTELNGIGQKAGMEGQTVCPKLCSSLVKCIPNDPGNAKKNEMIASLSCEILCTKQFQLFQSCGNEIVASCSEATSCIKKNTNGLVAF